MMIRDREHAATIAADLAQMVLDEDKDETIGEVMRENRLEFFDEARHYRFTAEAFWLHQCGKGLFGYQGSWKLENDNVKLALTLYCANVPILAAFIPEEKVPVAAPKPPAPGRGFDSINVDASNRGTIYEREDFGSHQWPAPAVAEALPLSPPVAESDQGSDPAADAGGRDGPEVVIDEGTWGGDVIDDDDEIEGAEGGDVEGDDETPPIVERKPARKKKR